MTPEQERRLKRVEDLLSALIKSDRLFLTKDLQFADGRRIVAGRSEGLQIGTYGAGPFRGAAVANPEKNGFFGATPIGPYEIDFPETAAELYTALHAFGLGWHES